MFTDFQSSDDVATIIAITTPPGNGGVGIVRLSGPRSYEIAARLGCPTLKPRFATMATIKLENDIQDNTIAIYFQAPNSFTGEDIVEIQAHGGAMLLSKIVNETIKHGARLAKPGEFTRRALMNGKITMTGAEALINIIHAESDAELVAASNLGSGELHGKMLAIEKELVDISAQIEGALDHPEDIALDTTSIKAALENFIATLSSFTATAKQSAYIYDGIRVAILGKPNVGKSSLFNALLGTDRSIVTEIAGTTTDVVSETIQIDGFKVRFIDTAGICETTNKIERLGVERSIQTAKECDIAIVFDDTGLALVKDKPHIIVTRKSDPEQIKKEIIQKTIGDIKIQSRTIANTRQIAQLLDAKKALESALVTTQADCMASDIQTALFHIGNITGTNPTEAVLDEIFSRFCLGK